MLRRSRHKDRRCGSPRFDRDLGLFTLGGKQQWAASRFGSFFWGFNFYRRQLHALHSPFAQYLFRWLSRSAAKGA